MAVTGCEYFLAAWSHALAFAVDIIKVTHSNHFKEEGGISCYA
jgi:hypothetical protein